MAFRIRDQKRLKVVYEWVLEQDTDPTPGPEPDPDTYARLGSAYDLAGRPALARESYMSALELDPEHRAAAYGLSNLESRESDQH